MQSQPLDAGGIDGRQGDGPGLHLGLAEAKAAQAGGRQQEATPLKGREEGCEAGVKALNGCGKD